MIVITKIYKDIEQSKQMVASFESQGYEVAAVRGAHKGNGETLRELHNCYKRASTGHDLFCYSDIDAYCQKRFDVPNDKIIYSAEKACYPLPNMASEFKRVKTQWKYLNGGGYCGSLGLIIEFFERYGLTKHKNDCNGQLEQMQAYLKAIKDGFPIELDYKCKIFQTISHHELEDFSVKKGLVYNNETKTTPAIIHANGRTPCPEFFPFKIW